MYVTKCITNITVHLMDSVHWNNTDHYWNANLNRWVLSADLNPSNVDIERISNGRVFQRAGAQFLKALSLKVFVQGFPLANKSWSAERSDREGL